MQVQEQSAKCLVLFPQGKGSLQLLGDTARALAVGLCDPLRKEGG